MNEEFIDSLAKTVLPILYHHLDNGNEELL